MTISILTKFFQFQETSARPIFEKYFFSMKIVVNQKMTQRTKWRNFMEILHKQARLGFILMPETGWSLFYMAKILPCVENLGSNP
jgi:hypothetical protein